VRAKIPSSSSSRGAVLADEDFPPLAAHSGPPGSDFAAVREVVDECVVAFPAFGVGSAFDAAPKQRAQTKAATEVKRMITSNEKVG